MKVFALDDDRTRLALIAETLDGKADITFPTHYEEAVHMWSPPYDIILLDHDLGDVGSKEKTGADFAKYIAGQLTAKDVVFIHSWNPDGAKAIEASLKPFVFVCIQPFGRTLLNYLYDLVHR